MADGTITQVKLSNNKIYDISLPGLTVTPQDLNSVSKTVYVGTAQESPSYFKISDFGSWGTGAWYQKNFSMLISSRAGELIWVSLAANDSGTSAGAFRLVNRYSKIHKIYYNAEDNSIYVHAVGWANNICAHIISNVNGDQIPSITQISSIPDTKVEIPIKEFGIDSESVNISTAKLGAGSTVNGKPIADTDYVDAEILELYNKILDGELTYINLRKLAEWIGTHEAEAIELFVNASGDTLTGPLVLTGGDSATAGKLILDKNGLGQITDNTTSTLFGFTSNSNLTIGHSSYNLNLRGAQTNPTYNGIGISLATHVHNNYASNVTVTGSGNAITNVTQSGNTITATKGNSFSLSNHNHDSAYSKIGHNHDDAYVNISGDTMTGSLGINGKIIQGTTSSDSTVSSMNRLQSDLYVQGDGSAPNAPRVAGFYLGKSTSDENRHMDIVSGSEYSYIDFNQAGAEVDYNVRLIANVQSGYTEFQWGGSGTDRTLNVAGTLKQAGQPVATQEWVAGRGYLTSLPSHNHDDRYYTESESDSRFVNIDGDTMTGTLIAPIFKSNNTDAAIKISDSNEVNFGSNANYIYFGYDNRVSSPGIVDTYYFGRSNGAGGSMDGDIVCGSVSTGRTVKVGNAVTLQYNSSNACLDFIF